MRRFGIVAGIAALICCAAPLQAKLMLFGGSEHDDYIGCLDCSKFSSDAICNEFGSMGSKFSSNSIFKNFGKYGNHFSSKSPWNQFTSSNDVPVLVDESGNFYGYFTINQFRSKAVSFASDLKALYESVDGDLDLVREGICQAFSQ